MIDRPRSILAISWLFIAVGCITAIAALVQLLEPSRHAMDLGLVLITRILAVVCGAFMLRGFNWARWLLVVWMAYHVIISLDATLKLFVHGGLLAALSYALFRPRASAWFRARRRAAPIRDGMRRPVSRGMR